MKPRSSTKAFERAALPRTTKMSFRLYIAGSSDRSIRAIQNAREICDEYLSGRYELDIIDILKQPVRASEDHVLAVPVLIKRQPPPTRRFIGDLSDRNVVLAGLELKPK